MFIVFFKNYNRWKKQTKNVAQNKSSLFCFDFDSLHYFQV